MGSLHRRGLSHGGGPTKKLVSLSPGCREGTAMERENMHGGPYAIAC